MKMHPCEIAELMKELTHAQTQVLRLIAKINGNTTSQVFGSLGHWATRVERLMEDLKSAELDDGIQF